MNEPCRLVRLRPRAGTLHVSRSRTVLATGMDGLVAGAEHGLFVHETRLLSRWAYLIDGEPPEPVALSNVEQHTWLGYYITLPPDAPRAPPDGGSGHVRQASQETLELRVSRAVGEGLHEDLDLANYTQRPTAFRLELLVEADFADQSDVDAADGQRAEPVAGSFDAAAPEGAELSFEVRDAENGTRQGRAFSARLQRALTLRVRASDSPPTWTPGRLAFDIRLPPGGRWHACLELVPFVEDRPLPERPACPREGRLGDLDRRERDFDREATAFEVGGPGRLAGDVLDTLDRARCDLAALRLFDLDLSDREWTVAAGLPMYIALYGRDTLTAAWQASLASTRIARGTLPLLARWQGRQVDDWRDEQPGKMLHEAHTGPSAVLGRNPRERYYGSITTSAFYPVALSELWHWTGEMDLARPLLEPALAALRWLDEQADHGGRGFYAYLTRSEQGVRHQAWKDSGDAIVGPDGSQVEPPIATCEEQSFVYAAKLQLAELLWWADDKAAARRLWREARELKARFLQTFWMEDEGFLALGLDADGRPIRSIASNAGHCLATGIVDRAHAERVAQRLMQEDLFSGWGVRTLSTRHPAYDPYSYHRGTVWPVEQGTFALGFMRFGLHEPLERLCRAQFEAAALFEHHRLPECFSGHPRDAAHPFPALYPRANSPQAWSASSVFCLVQALLGLYPYAPLNLLLVDPHLPDWLPELTLRGLRVGRAVVTLRFERGAAGGTGWRVLEQEGPLHVLRQPSPWSLTATAGERVKDVLQSLLPGR